MYRRTAAALAVLLGALAVPVASTAQARTAPPPISAPPMGWNSRLLACDVSEAAIKNAADTLAGNGLAAAGYRHVIIDGCWLAKQRDQQGGLVADPARFPSGIKALADYVHGKGLKLGLSHSAGTAACSGGGPGAYRHEAADGAQIASWGVDYLKDDWCSIPTADFPGQNVQQIAQTLYPPMRDALGDSVAFAMNNEDGSTVPWLWGRQVATTWRTNVVTSPLADSYGSMVTAWENNMLRGEYAGPGSWNDPDLLQAGRGGMSAREYQTQFSLWAVMASPLIAQADVAKLNGDLIGNAKVIAVDQDPLGVQGRYTSTDGWYHVIDKPLGNGDHAVVLFNESNRYAIITATAGRLRLPASPEYRVEDLWTGAVSLTKGNIGAAVPPHGVVMYRISGGGRADAPPAVTFEVDPSSFLGNNRPTILEPGRANRIITRVVNTGGTDRINKAAVSLTLPDGWKAKAVTPATSKNLAAGDVFETTWEVTPPADGQLTTYQIGGKVTWKGGPEITSGADVLAGRAPASGTTYLSDLPWTVMTNHLGSVERDRSNGDGGAADGRPLTVEGTVYAKGLGGHAPADVEFYVGGRCSTVEFLGGVDDEVDEPTIKHGSVEFQVWTDGELAARSGVVTGDQPAKKVTASVKGATYIRLVATNGVDNAYWDHADFADAKITCD
ncbi:NPCBM/NEW2 domain-containing protein [Streptosporangium subroseum]|uniref:NPCBM/NEW2 domain-containing protein n=1 Tax=Streptosporangium subroseum TaxID=106412 RepID=UPI00308CE288|nr:NPCBM/NEW2 domain-containing protein [Streptosporangium subroseum]